MDNLESILKEAIYGGPAPFVKELEDKFNEYNLKSPCYVAAIRADKTADITSLYDILNCKANNRLWVLDLHIGLIYLTFNAPVKSIESALKNSNWLIGKTISCPNVSKWISSIQRAITTLRKQELAQLQKSDIVLKDLSLESERQSRTLAIEALWNNDNNWISALQVWIEVVMHRHTNHLNDVKRKLIEFITDLTRNIDYNIGLLYPFRLAMADIYKTYAFSDIPKVMVDIVKDIKPHLIKPIEINIFSPSLSLTNKTIHYLNENSNKPFKLKDLTFKLNVSSGYLSRTFRSYTGKTIVEYLHTLRIGEAKKLLCETNYTILAISFDTGFESVEHFHRIFKRITGVTPATYRKKQLVSRENSKSK